MNVSLALAAEAVSQLNDRIKELEGDLNIAILQRDAARNVVSYYGMRHEEDADRVFDLEIQVAKLSTPLWFKIVAWFAR